MNRRHLLALGLVAAVLASVGGTGGFGSTNAGRSVEVAVVDDEAAYLGIERHGVNGDTWKVTLTNRLSSGEPLDVTVTVETRTGTPDDRTSTATPTSTGSVTETVRVEHGSPETITVDGVTCGDTAEVAAETDDGSVVIEATREVTCEESWGTPTATTTATPTAVATGTPTATATATPTPTSTDTPSAGVRPVDPSP